jgi:hypothetical protein
MMDVNSLWKEETLATQITFLTVHNLRILGCECHVFYLDKIWINQNHSRRKIHLAGLIRKKKLESPYRKRGQSYCMPHRISKNRLYSFIYG